MWKAFHGQMYFLETSAGLSQAVAAKAQKGAISSRALGAQSPRLFPCA